MRSAETFGKYTVDFPKGREVINARVLLGESFYKLRDYEKSANSFYAVIREAPYRYPGVYLNLSRILLRTKQYEDSVNILSDMIGHFSAGGDMELLSQAYIELGGAYYGMERYHEALISYRAGIEKTRGREGAEMVQFMIGDCLFRLNKKDDAKEIFTRLSNESNGLVKEYSQEKLKDLEMNISM
jgi:TolA-binding protein